MFTNFPYLLRNFNEFKIVTDDGKPIRFEENEDVDSDTSPRGTSVALSKAGSGISRVGKHILGYSPIPQHMLERSSEYILRWLKENGLTQPIQKFPHDLIENNGIPIFDLVAFLTGKPSQMKTKIDGQKNRNEKVKALYKQYEEFIRSLKENGALLNTIRPEFLIKLADYNAFLKIAPNANVNPSLPKMNEQKFQYLSVDAWTTLFYQIIKIYYLGRVNLKTFKTLPGISHDKMSIPEYYLDGSNLFSSAEGILLRWLEIHCEITKPHIAKRLAGFDVDLRDGHVHILYLYIFYYMNVGYCNCYPKLYWSK